MPRFTAAVKIPLHRQHFSSRILLDRKLSETISSDYGSNKERNVHLEMRNLKQTEEQRKERLRIRREKERKTKRISAWHSQKIVAE